MSAAAVALLRLFYAQENLNAPAPQKRTKKQLALAHAAGPVVGRDGAPALAGDSEVGST